MTVLIFRQCSDKLYYLVSPALTFTARIYNATYIELTYSRSYTIGKDEVPLRKLLPLNCYVVEQSSKRMLPWSPYNFHLLMSRVNCYPFYIYSNSMHFLLPYAFITTSFSNSETWVALEPCIWSKKKISILDNPETSKLWDHFFFFPNCLRCHWIFFSRNAYIMY